MKRISKLLVGVSVMVSIAACSSSLVIPDISPGRLASANEYQIGPGDTLNIFVWRNENISVTVPVRPDGKISIPLVEDMIAVGKTPTRLGRDIETALSQFIKSPSVTVIVTNFVGTFSRQIRVVGQATSPRAISYRNNMTLLDVIIEVGGLTEFAAGNKAKLVRTIGGGDELSYTVRLKDLVDRGDISANMKVYPGDILIIPETRF
jgi:polysaccharide export outer membrane protein